jgi:hypothetical protein
MLNVFQLDTIIDTMRFKIITGKAEIGDRLLGSLKNLFPRYNDSIASIAAGIPLIHKQFNVNDTCK